MRPGEYPVGHPLVEGVSVVVVLEEELEAEDTLLNVAKDVVKIVLDD